MICSMESGAESDLDVQAYCRSLALQQIQMLTRLAEIAMQLAEAEGARALAAQAVAAQARAARPEADEAAVEAAKAEAQEAGMAFGRSPARCSARWRCAAAPPTACAPATRPWPPTAKPPARTGATATAMRSRACCAT